MGSVPRALGLCKRFSDSLALDLLQPNKVDGRRRHLAHAVDEAAKVGLDGRVGVAVARGAVQAHQVLVRRVLWRIPLDMIGKVGEDRQKVVVYHA